MPAVRAAPGPRRAPVSKDQRASPPDHLKVLAEGEIEVKGRMPWSSNCTYLVICSLGEEKAPAIYKPASGERPLWDFPPGLYMREVAAYALSEALGWRIVPDTIVREDAPMGRGSLQRFMPADFSQHYLTLVEDPLYHQELKKIAVFDLLSNNADRKSGHCLLADPNWAGHSDGFPSPSGKQVETLSQPAPAKVKLWAVDHGLCFLTEPKLRTVIWDFAGQAIADDLLEDVSKLLPLPARLLTDLEHLLHLDEIKSLQRRAQSILDKPYFPVPTGSHYDWPWPLI